MSRFAVLLPLMLAACPRHFPTVEPLSAQPAFLGPASGVYLVNKSELASEGTRFLLVEFGGSLVLVGFSEDVTSNVLTTFRGAMTRDSQGRASVSGLFQLVENQTNELLTANGHLDIGLNVADFTFDAVPGIACPDDKCLFNMNHQCDFDSGLSGTFPMLVEKTAESGDCSTVPDLAGPNKQWALSIVNGANTAGLVGLSDAGTVELSALLSLDRLNQTLALAIALPVESTDYRWINTSKGTFTLGVGDVITLAAEDLVRVTNTGCTQHFRVQGSRLRGTTQGVECPAATGKLACGLNYAPCPETSVIAALRPTLILTTDVTKNDSFNTSCPASNCVATLPGSALCADDVTRATAANGCRNGTNLHTLVEELVPSTMNSGGGDGFQGCLKLSCGATCTVTNDQQPQQMSALGCTDGATVVFRREDNNCAGVSCRGDNDRCPPPDLPCQTLGWNAGPTAAQGDGSCSSATCTLDLSDSVKSYLAAHVPTGGYRITGFNPRPDMFTPATPILEAAGNGGSNSDGGSSCMPIDFGQLTALRCPRAGTVPFNHLCSDPATGALPAQKLALMRANGGLCLALIDGHTGDAINAQTCGGGQQLCCVMGSEQGDRYECRPPSSAPGYQLTVTVTNSDVPYPFNLTINGHADSAPSTNTLTLGVPAGTGKTATDVLPFRPPTTTTVYNFDITNVTPGVRCTFSSGNQTSASFSSTTSPIPVTCAQLP